MVKHPGLVSCFVVLTSVGAAQAQTSPSPGPTDPVPPNPQTQPGATIVVNPTTDECRAGWNASQRWTKEQFEEFCTRLGTSK